MSTQPEALRLADLLESCPLTVGDAQQAVAAAELRRLHALCTEWEAKAATWLASPEAAQRLNGYRELAQQVDALEQANQELLEALEWVSRRCPEQFLEQPPHRIHWEAAYDAGACARAAIAKHGSGA